jgi:hypothetical protein
LLLIQISDISNVGSESVIWSWEGHLRDFHVGGQAIIVVGRWDTCNVYYGYRALFSVVLFSFCGEKSVLRTDNHGDLNWMGISPPTLVGSTNCGVCWTDDAPLDANVAVGIGYPEKKKSRFIVIDGKEFGPWIVASSHPTPPRT